MDVYMLEGIKSKDDIEIKEINENIEVVDKKTSLKEVDDRFMTIDDLLDNIEK